MWKQGMTVVLLCAGLLGAGAVAAAAGGAGDGAGAAWPATRPASSFDGVVEAVRQTVVAAQVAGAVTALDVKAGDTVKAGQVLARIDARAAEQNASASDAQVRSAQALLDVASKDFERQKQLFDKQYISQAALERAESQFKATQAQAAALLAQAGAARTQSGFHVVRAPYAGVVAEVPVALGDMAMPGRALLTLVRAGGPARHGGGAAKRAGRAADRACSVEFPRPARGAALARCRAACRCCPRWMRRPTRCSCASPLPAGLAGVAPGMFARVWLPATGQSRPGASVRAGRGRRAPCRGERCLRGRRQGCAVAAPGALGPRRRATRSRC